MTSVPVQVGAPIVGVGALLLRPDGALLIGHRIKRGKPASWCLPGGHVEPGESFEAAAVREIAEESGIRTVTDARVFAVVLHTDADRTHLTVGVVARVALRDAVASTPEPEVFDRWVWARPTELPAPLFPASAALLALGRGDAPPRRLDGVPGDRSRRTGARWAMSRLHVFDMDGTLLRGTTASLQIARRLDCLPALLRLEAAFTSGAVDTRAFAAEICRLWQGLTPRVVRDVFAEAPWIDGLPEVLDDIRGRGERSVVVTMSPDFFADGLRDLGVDEVVASRFPPPPFRTAPDPAGILSPSTRSGPWTGSARPPPSTATHVSPTGTPAPTSPCSAHCGTPWP
ncbi:hypothetical protein GCM10020000_82610 [Streptomyces olivoverticillatus]